jgi:hypothetical protein
MGKGNMAPSRYASKREHLPACGDCLLLGTRLHGVRGRHPLNAAVVRRDKVLVVLEDRSEGGPNFLLISTLDHDVLDEVPQL